MSSRFTERFLVTYSSVLTTACLAAAITACTTSKARTRFSEIDVQRINVVEPDGTVRLVISDKTRFPGSFAHGREIRRQDRTAAGLLFLNEEGTEMGGLIFDGQKDKDGQVRSNGHLSFDQYDQDQIVSIDGGQEGAAKRVMMVFSDRGDWPIWGAVDEITRIKALPPSQQQEAMAKFLASHPGDHNRIILGRAADQSAVFRMADPEGHDRIVMRVTADGKAVLQFLDESGKVLDELPRREGARHR